MQCTFETKGKNVSCRFTINCLLGCVVVHGWGWQRSNLKIEIHFLGTHLFNKVFYMVKTRINENIPIIWYFLN
jgi:hypothetical protein